MQSTVHFADRARLIRLVNIVAAITLVVILHAPAQADSVPFQIQRKEALLYKRDDVQKQIQSAATQLRQAELVRRDKLEEIDELYRARASLSRRHSFSKEVENEIADQSRKLRVIEEQRSDCLEVLDGLYRSLSQINRDVADCNRAIH